MDKQVKISIEAHQSLSTLAAKRERSLKDFLEQSIRYFKITELDPKEIDADGIKVEIKKLDRRIVSFFKTQEKEKIAPILDELSIISRAITESLNIAPSKKDFGILSGIVKEYIQKLIDNQNNLGRIMAETRSKDMNEIKQKAKGIFQDYLQEIETKGTLVSRKPIDDKYRKLFESI